MERLASERLDGQALRLHLRSATANKDFETVPASPVLGSINLQSQTVRRAAENLTGPRELLFRMCPLTVAILSIWLAVRMEVARADEFITGPNCSIPCAQMIANSEPHAASFQAPVDETTRAYGDLLRSWKEKEQVQSAAEANRRVLYSVASQEIGRIPLAGSTISAVLKEAQDSFEKQSHEADRQIFGRFLKTIEDTGDLSGLKREVARNEQQDVLQLLDDRLRRAGILQSTESAFDSLNADARYEAQKSITRMMLASTLDLAKVARVNRSDIESLKQQIAGLTKTLAAIRRQQHDVREAAKPLEAAKSAADVHRGDVVAFVASAQNYGKQFDALADIMGQVHASPNAQRAMAITGAGLGASAKLASCSIDPYECLPAVASSLRFISIFGGGSQDSDLASWLEEIEKKLVEIERKIDTYHQEEMHELHLIQANQLLLYDAIVDIHIEEIAGCGYLVNREAYQDPDGQHGNWGLLKRNASPGFASYEAFAATARTHSSAIEGCLTGMGKLFSPYALRIDPALRVPPIDADIQSSSEFSDAEKKEMRAHRVFLAQLDVINAYLQPQVTELASIVSTTPAEIDRKVASAAPRPDSDFLHRNFDAEIYAPVILRVTGTLLGMHSYWELAYTNAGPLPMSRFARAPGNPQIAQSALEQTERVLDVAVAQQALLGGDALLPLAFKAWESQRSSPTGFDSDSDLFCGQWLGHTLLKVDPEVCANPAKARIGAIELRAKLFNLKDGLLLQNPLLARNLARYISYHRALERHCTPDFYALAYESKKQSLLLRKCLGDDLGLFLPSARGWHMTLLQNEVPLPTPDEFASQAILILPITIDLIDIRRRIDEARIGYRVSGELQSHDWRATSALLRSGAWPPTAPERR